MEAAAKYAEHEVKKEEEKVRSQFNTVNIFFSPVCLFQWLRVFVSHNVCFSQIRSLLSELNELKQTEIEAEISEFYRTQNMMEDARQEIVRFFQSFHSLNFVHKCNSQSLMKHEVVDKIVIFLLKFVSMIH